MKLTSKHAAPILVIILLGSLTSCGVSSAPFAEEDYCKPVMKIIGKFTDIQLRSMDNLSAESGSIKSIVAETRALAEEMPAGPKRDYVSTLADDFELFLNKNATMEASMGYMADITMEKLSIVCPNPLVNP